MIESLIALAAATVGGQLANMVATLMLAHILAPADFGAIGVATLVISAFTLLRNTFIYQTLIHQANRVREAADEMGMLAVGSGLVLFIVSWVGADHLGAFFHSAESASLVRLFALAFLIDSIGCVPDTLLEKELRFRKKMGLELARPVAIAVVSVALALAGLGAPSVGWARVVGYSVWTIGIFRLAEYLPRPRWDLPLMRELLAYGRDVFAGAVLVFLYGNLDNASIGRLLGAKALGYYAFAFQLAYLPALLITGGIVSSVLMPVYARLQSQRDEQATALLTTLRYVTYYAAPIAVGTIVLGPFALHVVYGKKWIPMFETLRVLAIYGFFHSYFIVIRTLCNGVGRAKVFSWITGLQLAIVLPLLVPIPLRYGILGTAYLFTLAKIVCVAVGVVYATRFTGVTLRSIARPVALPVAVAMAVGMAACVVYVLPWQHGRLSLLFVAVAIVGFFGLYSALCLLFDPTLPKELARLIGQRTRNRGRATTPPRWRKALT